MNHPNPFNGIRTLDHPVLGVHDLAASRAVYERLGFTVPPRGSHVEWGTGNLCIMFPDDYVELRGIIDPDRFTMNLDAHLERYGEGLMGVAFGTMDVVHSRRELRRHGVEVGPVRRLTRNFEHPEGWTRPSFALCLPEPAAIEELMHVVVLQHLTPELLRRPEFVLHPNGCVGVDSVCGLVRELAPAARRMARLLGRGAVTVDESALRATLPSGQRIELLLPAAFGRRFGEPAAWVDTAPRLANMTLRVADLDRTRDLLRRGGVDFAEAGAGVVRVPANRACGAIIDFIAAAPGDLPAPE